MWQGGPYKVYWYHFVPNEIDNDDFINPCFFVRLILHTEMDVFKIWSNVQLAA